MTSIAAHHKYADISQGPAVLQLDTQRKVQTISPLKRDRLRKRQQILQETLDNEGTLYFTNVTLGTPAQALRLDIDTGSSDLWTNSATSSLCQRQRTACAESGTYAANQSSTYTYINSAFKINYADGSYAIGDYATDVFDFGGQAIQGTQFGIGYNSTSLQGILGIGYTLNEASISTIGKTYNNVPVLLKNQGIISVNAYSLWLNDLSANTGSILFGGVDRAKYTGNLYTLPIIQEAGRYREFIIALSGVTAAGQTIFNNNPIPVLLDSGSSLSYLPNSYAQAIYTIFGAQYSSTAQAAVVSCNMANNNANVVFNFSGVQITVPMNELVILAGYQRGVAVCILGIVQADSSTAVLGDTFLRSAYVVYNLDGNTISLAQTNFNATGSSIQEITSSSTIPGATVVTNAVSTLAVSGGNGRLGQPTVSAAAAAPRQTGMQHAAKFGVAMAAGLAMVL